MEKWMDKKFNYLNINENKAVVRTRNIHNFVEK